VGKPFRPAKVDNTKKIFIDMPPSVPDDVELTEGTFTNAQGMQLATFSWCLKPRGLLGTAPRPKGIVLLLHGYGSHTFFEWMHAPAPGEPHTKFTGTVIEGCVRDGWAVHAIDHQGHGQSEGARAYFERFTHLADEASAYVDMLLSGDRWRGLPVFLWSVSMGGATALTMARRDPDKYAGLVLYAPMISLEQVHNQEVLPGIKNGHLRFLVHLLSAILPTVPIAKAARNTVHPKAQEEFDTDPLCWHGNVKNRLSKEFLDVSDDFLGGGLAEISTPFVTYHSEKDTLTDPYGSQRLFDLASTGDKAYIRVGAGLDLDAEIWHALACEPGHEKIREHALAWIGARK
jgi:acylglycerol lipase